MATLKVTDRELQTILAELESDLDGYLTDTQAKLSKAREEDGSPSAGMGALSASGSSPSASGGSPSASMGSPSASGGSPSAGGEEGGFPGGEGEEAPPMEGAPPAGEPGMEGAPAGEPGMEGQPGAEGPVDPAALEAEYAKLPIQELQAHYLAAKAALFAAMGQGQGQEQGAPQGAPPPSAPPPAGPSAGAPPPAGPSAGAPPMAMSEGKQIPAGSGIGGEMSKNESDLQAQVEKLTSVLSLFIGKPIQKAVTGTSYVAKSEETTEVKSITPAQVTAKLSQLTRSPDLKKSDRDLVNGYYEGTVKVDAIAHLLK